MIHSSIRNVGTRSGCPLVKFWSNAHFTFSFKYRDYLSYVRQRQIARAQALLDSGRATVSKRKSPNDAKRFIKAEYCTEDGELAQVESFSLNQEMIEQEARFDGFYCICTDLNAPTEEVIRLNGGRWIVENDFRMTKTEMEARPVYLKRASRRTHDLLPGPADIQVSGKEGEQRRDALHLKGNTRNS